jgi:hypothetical protein
MGHHRRATRRSDSCLGHRADRRQPGCPTGIPCRHDRVHRCIGRMRGSTHHAAAYCWASRAGHRCRRRTRQRNLQYRPCVRRVPATAGVCSYLGSLGNHGYWWPGDSGWADQRVGLAVAVHRVGPCWGYCYRDWLEPSARPTSRERHRTTFRPARSRGRRDGHHRPVAGCLLGVELGMALARFCDYGRRRLHTPRSYPRGPPPSCRCTSAAPAERPKVELPSRCYSS